MKDDIRTFRERLIETGGLATEHADAILDAIEFFDRQVRDDMATDQQLKIQEERISRAFAEAMREFEQSLRDQTGQMREESTRVREQMGRVLTWLGVAVAFLSLLMAGLVAYITVAV